MDHNDIGKIRTRTRGFYIVVKIGDSTSPWWKEVANVMFDGDTNVSRTYFLYNLERDELIPKDVYE